MGSLRSCSKPAPRGTTENAFTNCLRCYRSDRTLRLLSKFQRYLKNGTEVPWFTELFKFSIWSHKSNFLSISIWILYPVVHKGCDARRQYRSNIVAALKAWSSKPKADFNAAGVSFQFAEAALRSQSWCCNTKTLGGHTMQQMGTSNKYGFLQAVFFRITFNSASLNSVSGACGRVRK